MSLTLMHYRCRNRGACRGVIGIEQSWGATFVISCGCGGPYKLGEPVDVSRLTARDRLQVQDAIAHAIIGGRLDRAEGEALLDAVFADPVARLVAPIVNPPARYHARKEGVQP